MAGCDDTRQITEAQRQAGYQSQRTGVQRAVRPFTGRPTVENLIDYINRELFPAVRSTRDRVNDIYLPVVDNAPSANPLGFFFSDSIVNADPTAGRIRLNAATQDTATVIRVSENNGRLTDVAPWLDVMSGSVTSPLGVVTLFDAVNPARFIRFDLSSMSDAGTYWNLTVVPVESSHDNPFVDGEPVSLSFIPGVGGGTPATIPPTAISGADGPRQFLSTSTGTVVDWRTLSATFPGAPIYDVMAYPFNAAGDGVADDTTAINAAIAAANTTPGWIYLGQRHRITAALTTVSGNNILILGRGDFNGGSRIIVDSAAAIDVLVFTGQYSGVQDVWFVGIRVYTSGWAIRVRNAFRVRITRCVISQLCFGVEVFRSVLTYLDKVNIDDIYGVFAFWAGGDSGGENHAVTFRSCTAGVSMPGSIVGAASAWAAGTAYAVGKVVVANSGLYQAVQAGTSAGAGTGPSGIPGATNATVHTAQITDGTVKWVFAMPAFVGFLQDSYCHTFEMIDCGVLQGLYGFSMEDSANTGSSYPQFARARNLQVDHPMSRGVRLAAGGAARFDSTFVTSVFGGVGIEVGSSFKGNWEFIGGEVFGCSEAGVVINKGDGEINGLQIGACGSVSSNTRDCIEVGNSASRWSVVGCSAGQMFAGTSPATRYGISVAAGCDNYVIEGNRFTGNVTGGILNTPGRSSTRAVLNNIPGVTISLGSFWGLQCDASGAAVPVEVTCAEATENLRRRTVQTVSGVSGTLDIALDDDATVLLIRTTADATLRTLEDSSGLGDGREIVIEHDRLSGSGNLTIAHNSAGTYVAFFNPDTTAIVLGQTTCLVVRARSGFWRPQSSVAQRMRVRKNSAGTVFRRGGLNLIEGSNVTLTVADDATDDEVDVTIAASGLSDGDKGDITVSSSGTVWTVDTNIAKTWTGIHSFTGASHTVNVTGAVNIDADAASRFITSVGDLTLQTTQAASRVIVSGADDVLIEAVTDDIFLNSGGLTQLTSGTGIHLIMGTLFRVTTNSVERLEIAATGEWEVQGDAGDLGSALLSQGGSSPPLWADRGDVVTRTTIIAGGSSAEANIVSLVVAAGTWVVGTTYEFYAHCEYVRSGAAATSHTVTIDAELNGTAIGISLGVLSGVQNSVTASVLVHGTFTCSATGGSGTGRAASAIDENILVGPTAALSRWAGTSNPALDTTASNTLSITVDFSAGVAGVSFVCQRAWIRRVA